MNTQEYVVSTKEHEIEKRELGKNGLKKLDSSRRCEVGLHSLFGADPKFDRQCANTAFWKYNNIALCRTCMEAMSIMNSDNEQAFAPALAVSSVDQIA